MSLKENVWKFIKNIGWPFFRDKFICASKEEAEELITWAKEMKCISEKDMYEHGSAEYEEKYPKFIIRCIDAVEDDQE